MSVAKIPTTCLNQLETINKFFLWNGKQEGKNKGKINWKKVCQPNCFGGLGVRNLHILNNAFLLKHLWKLTFQTNTLWYQVYKNKYFPDTHFLQTEFKSHHSWFWRNLMKLQEIFKKRSPISNKGWEIYTFLEGSVDSPKNLGRL